MRLAPEEFDIELPRAILGGLKRGPTEELLRRVAKEYAALYEENRTLRAQLAAFEQNGSNGAHEPSADLPEAIEMSSVTVTVEEFSVEGTVSTDDEPELDGTTYVRLPPPPERAGASSATPLTAPSEPSEPAGSEPTDAAPQLGASDEPAAVSGEGESAAQAAEPAEAPAEKPPITDPVELIRRRAEELALLAVASAASAAVEAAPAEPTLEADASQPQTGSDETSTVAPVEEPVAEAQSGEPVLVEAAADESDRPEVAAEVPEPEPAAPAPTESQPPFEQPPFEQPARHDPRSPAERLSAPAAWRSAPAGSDPWHQAVHREPDELARVVLAATQRTVTEMREATRQECELMLRKASSHARKLERENVQLEAELAELQAMRRETAERMRASLQAILPQLVATGTR